MTMHATGPFDVKITPQDDKSDDPLLGRMTLDKQYHGDLEATGKGQMLTAGSTVKGSGGYVAIEKVTRNSAGPRRQLRPATQWDHDAGRRRNSPSPSSQTLVPASWQESRER